MRIRGGKLLAREHRFVENLEGEEDPSILSVYLAGNYVPLKDRARDLLVPFDFEDRELLEQSLGGKQGPKHVPSTLGIVPVAHCGCTCSHVT